MKKLSTKAKIIYGIIGLFLITGVIVPLFWPDNTSKYSGVKQDIAKVAVPTAWSYHSGLDYLSITGAFKVSVEDVTIGAPGDTLCNGEATSRSNPELGDHFVATVSFRTFFGIEVARSNLHICRFQN